MEANKVCPRCGSIAKRVARTYICQCGWTLSVNSQVKKNQSFVVGSLFLIASFLAVSLFHFLQWGNHAVDVLFADSMQKTAICLEVRKYDCAEEGYQTSFQKTGDIEYLSKLGEMQFKREKYVESENTYKKYFSKGGDSFKAAYYYAHSLTKNNRLDAAIEYFDTILRSKPKVLMITVMDSYLDILVNHNKRDKAKEVLSWVKKSNPDAESIQGDLARWEQRIKSI